MTSILLMIELTVVFYSTMIIWKAGTHQNAVSASAQNGLTGYRNVQGRASQRSKDHQADHSAQASSTSARSRCSRPCQRAPAIRRSIRVQDAFRYKRRPVTAGDTAQPSPPHRTGR